MSEHTYLNEANKQGFIKKNIVEIKLIIKYNFCAKIGEKITFEKIWKEAAKAVKYEIIPTVYEA